MCMTFCLIIKYILELIFMQFYTYNVMGTEMSPFWWNVSFHYAALVSRIDNTISRPIGLE